MQGWIWCSGSLVKAVDFVRPPANGRGDCYRLLQVKNRDNSENSSSAAIRDGTNIEKWFRTYSQRPDTNWESFPSLDGRSKLSEAGFREFAKEFLMGLRRAERG
jgi:hypothetical protein